MLDHCGTHDRGALRMAGHMDIDASRILSECLDLPIMGRETYNQIITTASGQATKSENLGLGDYQFVPWQIGATM